MSTLEKTGRWETPFRCTPAFHSSCLTPLPQQMAVSELESWENLLRMEAQGGALALLARVGRWKTPRLRGGGLPPTPPGHPGPVLIWGEGFTPDTDSAHHHHPAAPPTSPRGGGGLPPPTPTTGYGSLYPLKEGAARRRHPNSLVVDAASRSDMNRDQPRSLPGWRRRW